MANAVGARGGTTLLGLEQGEKMSGYSMGEVPETHAKSPG